ncbi:beta-ketoacyl synthase N-terminal-like domain-containing protein [Pedobacter sp. AW31-3R]|uniref:beta-ketoacyl synthase N-terminal-like domain-containing protein n=1 Tax=Pedobacter sp. AW31-3R TaxID=3445781 RepID=UPI003F9F703C
MKNEIAIIGIALQMGGANDMEALWEMVKNNETGFNALSEQRRKDLFDRFGVAEIESAAYMDRIDLFDHHFFNIPPAEAERMDPEQRIMLESAVKAIHNAGYVPADLTGERIGIFYNTERSLYDYFFDDTSNLSLVSHMPAMMGARLANFMDWRGPVMGIDTTCSSSLVALYQACQSIMNDECTMALAGGVNLEIPFHKIIKATPVQSKSQQCRPFDNSADGILGGEGAICVLLKRLDEALADGDPIHAVVKGAAINHSGGYIQNISAPSPTSQREVIQMAWKNAGIDPKRIRFVEAHGTGTVLGDPIEFAGLASAFEGYGAPGEKICSISSVKGQFGHLNALAGLAGLARLVLALKHKKLLPQPGFKEININIDEANASVYIQRELEEWQGGNGPRVGGLSSYGMSGTNVHVVLKEVTRAEDALLTKEDQQTYLLKIGGRTAALANDVKAYLLNFLKSNTTVNLNRFCYSVNKIAGNVEYGQAITFRTQEELIAILENYQPAQRQVIPGSEVYLFIPEVPDLDKLLPFLKVSGSLSAAYEKGLAEFDGIYGKTTNQQQAFLLQYYLLQLLMHAGFHPDKILGSFGGKFIAAALSGKSSLTDALAGFTTAPAESFNKSGFLGFLDTLNPNVHYDFFSFAAEGEMIDSLREWHHKKERNISLCIPLPEENMLNQFMSSWFNLGHPMEYTKVLSKEIFLNTLQIPVFDHKRFWPDVKPRFVTNTVNPAESAPVQKKMVSIQEITEELLAIWRLKLGVDAVGVTDDFFDLGGSSLMGLDMIALIERKYSINLEYADIFDYSTVNLQAALVMERLTERQINPETTVAAVEKQDPETREQDYMKKVHAVNALTDIPLFTPKHVLITGSTGFLGVHLLKHFLIDTEAKITCLVRADSNAQARERLYEVFEAYFSDVKPLQFEGRLQVISGELSEAGLGLNAAGAAILTGVDTICHSAALVSHFGKVEVSRAINYTGTVNLLDWAKANGVQYFNHVSTTAIAEGYIANIAQTEFYEHDLNLGQNFGRNIYSLTKFEAEQYLNEQHGNVKLKIFRVGNIGGATSTGLFQQNIDTNSFYQRLRSLADLGIYCDAIADHEFETSPVDKVAGAVFRLSLIKNEDPAVFHLESKPVRLKDLLVHFHNNDISLVRKETDYFLKYVNTVMQSADLSREHSILGIIRYGGAETQETTYQLRAELTRAYLDKLKFDFDYDSNQYYDTIIKYCIRVNFIENS